MDQIGGYVKGMTPGEWAMLLAGVALLIASAFVLWGRRWGKRQANEDGPRFAFPGIGVVSEPTRLMAGCFGLILAYHLMVWALPARTTPVQFPRSRWYIVLVLGAGAVGGSLVLDRLERVGREAG